MGGGVIADRVHIPLDKAIPILFYQITWQPVVHKDLCCLEIMLRIFPWRMGTSRRTKALSTETSMSSPGPSVLLIHTSG